MATTVVQFTPTTPNSTSTTCDKFPPLQPATRNYETFNEREFTFPAKSKFKAGQDILLTRSDSYVIRKIPPVEDIWRRPPPNFCPQNYAPKPPKRNSRESMQPWNYGTYPGHKTQVKRERIVPVPKAMQPERPKSTKLVNRFKILDPFEAKCLFVKEGMYRKEQYENPEPHDFRQYPPLGPLGLPEFDTTYPHDPYNIHFKTQHLNTIHGTRSVSPGTRFRGRQMGQRMEPKPRYEPDLIMPKGKWPNPGEEFTRHRQRNRSPHSALLERIDATLHRKWAQEKVEKERRQKEWEQQEKERKFRESIQHKLQTHEAEQWRRTGPGGWSGRSFQSRTRDRAKAVDEDTSSSTFKTLSASVSSSAS